VVTMANTVIAGLATVSTCGITAVVVQTVKVAEEATPVAVVV